MSIADTIEDTFADRDPATMAAAVVAGVCAALADAIDPQTITTRTSGGTVFNAIAWQGKLWSFDPDDTTTDHDAITCIRTIDSDGYFTDDVRMPNAVLSRSVTTPPDPGDSPATVVFGDAYLVPAGATDDWAGHEDEVALYTARGWVYKTGAHGDILMVEDEGETGAFIHFNIDDTWEDGLPGNLVDLSVRPSALLIRAWAVENQTTNAPPATGPAGEQYIIGGTPTGAWAGNASKIAWRASTDAAFVITTPFVGEEVYDKNQGFRFRWSGTSWVSAKGAWVDTDYVKTDASVTATLATPGVYYGTSDHVGYDNANAPAYATHNHTKDPVSKSYTAKRTAARIRLTYQAKITAAVGVSPPYWLTAFVTRDTVSAALDYLILYLPEAGDSLASLVFEFDAPDAGDHDYTVRFTTAGAGATGINTVARRTLRIEEGG